MLIIDSLRQFFRTNIRKLAKVLDKLTDGRLTPDTVTWVSVLAHLPIAVLIGYGKLELAAVLLVIFGLFDILDGELARLQKVASPRGMVLDASTDRIKEFLIYSGAAYYISRSAESGWVWLAVAACGTTLTVSYIKAKGEVAYAIKTKATDHHKINRLFNEGLVPFEGRITILIIGLAINQLLLAVGIVAVLGIISTFERLFYITKKIA